MNKKTDTQQSFLKIGVSVCFVIFSFEFRKTI